MAKPKRLLICLKMARIGRYHLSPLLNIISRGGVLLKNTEVVVINIFKSDDSQERDKMVKEILVKHLTMGQNPLSSDTICQGSI